MNVVTGLIFLGASGAIFFVAKDYPTGTVEEGMGARLVPLLLAGIMAILSLLLVLQGVFFAPEEVREDAFSGSKLIGRHLLAPAVLIALLGLYLLVLEWSGFLISTPVFLLAVMTVLGTGPVRSAAVGIAFTAGAYIVFALLLGVPLPAIPFLGW